MQIDTVRPLSVRVAGAAVAVPSGTIATVTADNDDATYLRFNLADVGPSGDWSLRMGPHTPAAGYGRHQIRGRIRARTDAGTLTESIYFGQGGYDFIIGNWGTVSATATMTELSTAWSPPPFLITNEAATVSDMNIGGGGLAGPAGGATQLRTAEVYLDIDCRLKPQYTGQIRDASGTPRNGDVVTDTDSPSLWFGTPSYDGLPEREWSVTVTSQDTGELMFGLFGAGIPPESLALDEPLPDGGYNVGFSVSSTIRDSDPFYSLQSFTFEVNNIVPPPSPPLLSAEREGEGYRLTWEFPGGQTWDGDYVIAEVWRDDCTGSQRIATVPDGLSGSYLDLAIPQLDVTDLCGDEPVACDVTYRVRYWGYVSTTVTLPTTVPVEMIIAWPSVDQPIPSGWIRVPELDGYYPRGATSAGNPIITGGAATHTHSTPNHTHRIDGHNHTLPGRTGFSNTSTTTERTEKGARALANQSHDHDLPSFSGDSGSFNSGATVAGMQAFDTEPATKEVLWIRSDGSATAWPVGALAYSMQQVSGWTKDSSSYRRYLKGAPTANAFPAGNYGDNSHVHVTNAHTHTGGVHDHPSFTATTSGPEASTRGNTGGGTPRWLGRHTHPINIVAGASGVLTSTGSSTITGSASSEPPHRRMFVLRNTNAGLQTRIIGLYLGSVGTLPATLTYCNGAAGTPDMRGWFAREEGGQSVNTTGGSATHTHSIPSHRHADAPHTHTIQVGQSNSSDAGRDTSGSTGNVPTETHTHTSDPTGQAFTISSTAGGGTSGSASSLPPYREVHFVRLDGTVDGGTLPTPEQRVSDFASLTVPAIAFADGRDRLSTLAGQVIAVAGTRGSSLPRLVADSVPLDGGLPTVSTTVPGEDVSLSLAVEGKDRIDALEELLRADRVYWAPAGGTPGWFAPGGWSVTGPAPDVKVLSVTMVRQPWPPAPDPVSLL